jgi:hypothetical protein
VPSARLGLLDTQYASDLSRLDMIAEAGNLLGFFSAAICPFCGSPVGDSSSHAITHQESVPFAEAVKAEIEYDRSENDIVADGQLRSGHGKGVRTVLHAAFTIALAQYCVAEGLPHPGFVVLDSPLVTYKPPKSGDEDLSDEAALLPRDFTARFYASVEDLASNVQVIVMENVNPPASQGEGLEDIEFSKSTSGSLRYGFFPYSPSSPVV